MRQGYLVRTMADHRWRISPDNHRAEAALASGAHSISTDFPGRNATGYQVKLPSGEMRQRLNPVTGRQEDRTCSA